jgi:hypothetical protein
MSAIGGSPIEHSLLQTAQAQQVVGAARDRERAVNDRARRLEDLVDLSVAGVETSEAVRRLPPNDSEESKDEGGRRRERPRAASQRIDLQA